MKSDEEKFFMDFEFEIIITKIKNISNDKNLDN